MPDSKQGEMTSRERDRIIAILGTIGIMVLVFLYIKFVSPIVSTFDRDRFISARGAPEQRLLQETLKSANFSDVGDESFKRGLVAQLMDNAICDATPSLTAKDWAGKVSEIQTERNGAGLVAIDIGTPYDITLSNFSRMSPYDKTPETKRLFIDVKDDIYASISKLSVGDNVLFSGQFIPTPQDEIDDGEMRWCVRQFQTHIAQMALHPRFVFKFTDIHSTH